MNQNEFDDCIATLDCGLFDTITAQSSDEDRKSWLMLQRAVRDSNNSFAYLEIGSYLGGSIQQYLLDQKCFKIYSIDKRPTEVPDARGKVLCYRDNSTQMMLDGLSAVAPDQLHKIVSFDSDARDIDVSLIDHAPDLCFIDGEHTSAAALTDFFFCIKVCAPNAVIYFHDESLIRPAIGECLCSLKEENRFFTAYKLPGSTFAIALNDSPANTDPRITEIALDGQAWINGWEFSHRVHRLVPSFIRPTLARIRDRWLVSRRFNHTRNT